MRNSLVFLVTLCAITAVGQAAGIYDGSEIEITPDLERNIVTNSDGRLALEIGDMRFLIRGSEKSVSEGTAWTANTVYYQFDASVDADDGGALSGDGAARRAAWRAAADEWSNTVPGLLFVEGMGGGNSILVKSAGVNNSFVGMIGGVQDMNIVNWQHRFIIAHEIGHALGLLHEQSRNDRDNFVTVMLANIQDAAEHNYLKAPASIPHGPYDYGSVMHYDRCAFWDDAMGTCGTDGFTLSAVPAGASSVGLSESQANAMMGQSFELTSGDIAGVRSTYEFSVDAVHLDGFDARHLRSWSSAVGDNVSCVHDTCAAGDPLHPDCDPCATTVCNIDSWCCAAEWDSICISIGVANCGLVCPP